MFKRTPPHGCDQHQPSYARHSPFDPGVRLRGARGHTHSDRVCLLHRERQSSSDQCVAGSRSLDLWVAALSLSARCWLDGPLLIQRLMDRDSPPQSLSFTFGLSHVAACSRARGRRVPFSVHEPTASQLDSQLDGLTYHRVVARGLATLSVALVGHAVADAR
jgi:hypothetical protein